MSITFRRPRPRVPTATTAARAVQPAPPNAGKIVERLAETSHPIKAAAAPIEGSAWSPDSMWQPIEAWQRRAIHFERIIGEVGGAADFMQYALGKIRFRAGLLDDAGKIAQDDNELARRVVMQLDSTLDKGRVGRLIFVTADCYVIVKKTFTGFEFGVASLSELIPWRGGFAIQEHPAFTPRSLWDQDTPKGQRPALYRVWKPDTEYSARPMGWIGRVLDHLEALVLMTLADKAVSLSRLAGAGILYLPSEAVLPSLANENPTGQLEPSILDRLTDGMVLPIADRSNPDSLVPIVLTGPAEYADRIKHLTFERITNPDDFEKRRTVHLRAVATASDLPASKFLNTDGDGKFWNAWQVDKNTSQGYVVPYAKLICDSLQDWYQYVLRAIGHPDPGRAVIFPDDSELVVNPDAGPTAIQLHQMGLIKRETVVEACNFSVETDMMAIDSEEYKQWLDVTLAQNQRLTNLDQTKAIPIGQQAPSESAGQAGTEQRLNRALGSRDATPDTQGARQPTGSRPTSAPPGTRALPAASLTPGIHVAAVTAELPPHLIRAHAQLVAATDSLVEQIDAALERSVRAALKAAGAKVASAGTKTRSADPVIAAAGARIAAVCKEIPADERHLTCALVGRDTVTAALGDEDILRDNTFGFDDELLDILNRAAGRVTAAMEAIGEGVIDQVRLDAITARLAERARRARAVAVQAAVAAARRALYDAEQNRRLVARSVAKRIAAIAAGARTSGTVDDWGVPEITVRTDDVNVFTYADGPEARELGREAGFRIGSFVWQHAFYGAPESPFGPHQALDKITFNDFTDSRLATAGTDYEWCGPHYSPGDHVACTCAVHPIWVPA